MYKANINCSVLNEYIDFLIKQDLIEKRTIKKERIVFEITQRGKTVLKYFRELEQALPILEETKTNKLLLIQHTNRVSKFSN
jgi:predicted transcriptional regulator